MHDLLLTDTAQREEEIALHQSERLIHAVLDHSPNISFLKDVQGRYLFVNRQFERALNVDRQQIEGKTDHDIFPAQQAAAFRNNDLRVIEARAPLEFEEATLQQGGLHTSIVQKFPLFDTNGNVFAIAGVATDITERKRAEQALRHSEERYRILVETATDAVISIDESSRILFANPATTMIFGYEPAELIGQSLTMLMPQSMRGTHEKALHRYVKTRKRCANWAGAELTGRRRTGEEFPIEVSFAEVERNGRYFFTGFIRDVSALRDSAIRLREMSSRMRQDIEEERKRISQSLHDELGQNLTALCFDAEWLRRHHHQCPATLKMLDRMKSSIEDTSAAMRRIVADLRPRVLDDLGILVAIQSLVQDTTVRTGIAITWNSEGSFDDISDSTKTALYRMLQECLTNIIRHARASTAAISLTARPTGIELVVTDNGCGFHVRAHPKKGSFGLFGLSERAVQLRGAVIVDSAVGNGTRIVVRLPPEAGTKPTLDR
jgi:PAS domain S-box-containing protein